MKFRRMAATIFAAAVLVLLAGSASPVAAQGNDATKTAQAETGYAVKKPVFGGACETCPWGSIAEIVKKAMKPYGWDIQI